MLAGADADSFNGRAARIDMLRFAVRYVKRENNLLNRFAPKRDAPFLPISARSDSRKDGTL